MKRNPRRAYDSEGREIEPMPLATMREGYGGDAREWPGWSRLIA